MLPHFFSMLSCQLQINKRFVVHFQDFKHNNIMNKGPANLHR